MEGTPSGTLTAEDFDSRRLIEKEAHRLVLVLPTLSEGHSHFVMYKRQRLIGDTPMIPSAGCTETAKSKNAFYLIDLK